MTKDVRAAAQRCADELSEIVEAATRLAKRTGNTFVLDRQRVAGMIAGHFSAPTPASSRDRLAREDLLTWLADHSNLELSFDGWGTNEWQVHAVNGGRNDREWKLIATGATPPDALSAALQALGGSHE